MRLSGGVGGRPSRESRGESGFFGVSLGGLMSVWGKIGWDFDEFFLFFLVYGCFLWFFGESFFGVVKSFVDVFAGEFFMGVWSVAG